MLPGAEPHTTDNVFTRRHQCRLHWCAAQSSSKPVLLCGCGRFKELRASKTMCDVLWVSKSCTAGLRVKFLLNCTSP